MFRLLTRASLLCVLLTWLALFSFESFAAPNYISHVHEKLWLWYMYNAVVNVQGADKQRFILPFNNRGGATTGIPYQNKGSGSDKRLTFNEFMARMRNEGLPADDMGLPEPGKNGATLESVAEDMLRRNNGRYWGAPLDTNVVHPDRMNVAGSYDELMQGLDKKLGEWRLTENTDQSDDAPWRKVRPYMENLNTLSERIVYSRLEDTWANYIPSVLRKDVGKGGLGLGDAEDAIEFEEKPSHLPAGIKETYRKVKTKETFVKNKKVLRAHGFKSRHDLKEWTDSMGDEDADPKVPYEAPSKSHAGTLKVWVGIKERNAASLADLAEKMKSC